MLLSSRRDHVVKGVRPVQKRVYFVGAQSTGKTTLSSFMARKLGWPLIEEQARAVLAEKKWTLASFARDIERAADFQRLVMRRQLDKEAELVGKDFISDRAFDGIAYAAAHTLVAHELRESLDFREYIGDFRTFGSITFFVRPHVALVESDGVRADDDWTSVCRIDGMLEYILETERIPYIPLEAVSMKSRVRTVEGVLHATGVPYG